MPTIADELRQRTFRYALRVLGTCRRLPDTLEGREVETAVARTSSNYRSACRGRSTAEFIARLGVAEDEAAESVMWLMLILQGGIREDPETKDLLQEGREITAILSKSHKTARENRRRQSKRHITNVPIDQLTNS